MTGKAFLGAQIFDGTTWHHDKALLAEHGRCLGVVRPDDRPPDFDAVTLAGGMIVPGFVDLQVNGGGGVLFNDTPSVAAIRTILAAHAATGTAAILPTLITDTVERSHAAVEATRQAIAAGLPGVLGLHLEGPHLALARKGAHDPNLIRPMQAEDEAFLIQAAACLPNVLVTLAPESVSPDQIARLTKAGVIVSLGHSDCCYAEAQAAFAAGAVCVTHLFNAMSQLGNREPGLVGATLDTGGVHAGVIADNIHVHAATLRHALAAKQGPGGLFLVTDAMPSVGSDITEFTLNGRRILRREGRLTLTDGTLAGADLDMPTALSVMIRHVGLDAPEAIAMATTAPCHVLNRSLGFGALTEGKPLRAIHLMDEPSGQIRFAGWLD